MGIEALSRGASTVTFNDSSKESLSLLKSNLQKCKVEEDYQIKNNDAITLLSSDCGKFDFIYIDPPYSTDLGRKALEKVGERLSDDGVAIYEDERPFVDEIKGLKITDTRKYGRAYLMFFSKEV